MLMGAEVCTIEHRNVALVALEHDRSAQGFYKKVIAMGFARQ